MQLCMSPFVKQRTSCYDLRYTVAYPNLLLWSVEVTDTAVQLLMVFGPGM